MPQGSNKKFIPYLTIIVAALLVIFLIWYFFRLSKVSKPLPEELETERQLRELERLRAGIPPLSEEEIQGQLQELEQLRQKQKPLSKEEIQKQLEELETLRSQ